RNPRRSPAPPQVTLRARRPRPPEPVMAGRIERSRRAHRHLPEEALTTPTEGRRRARRLARAPLTGGGRRGSGRQAGTWCSYCAVPAVGPGWGVLVPGPRCGRPHGAGGDMKRLRAAAIAVLFAAPLSLTAGGASAATPGSAWNSSVPFTNVVASAPTAGGGSPVPAGSRVPVAGTCQGGPFDANHSESWLAVKPGTEDLVGTSKFFFDKYSTFYMFYLGAYQILGGTPSGNNQVQGYDCVSTGTQEMPPSWTQTTDPNADFDTKGRVYQTTLPFNSFFDATRLHPDGEIDISFSDDMGRHWVKGNGGVPLEPPNNASAKQLGHVEDKQWVAVNHIVGNKFQDHVYAAWAVFNGNGGGIKVRMAVSRDRGQTFAKALTITPPSQVSAGATYVYPEIDAAGNVYVAVVSFPANGAASTIYVARSSDDAQTFSPFV